MYQFVSHEIFKNFIMFNYIHPFINGMDIASFYNISFSSGYEIIEILKDGVVYKLITM